jgi:hypothetical protein
MSTALEATFSALAAARSSLNPYPVLLLEGEQGRGVIGTHEL